MYVNLKLSINEEFLAHGTMVEILATPKSPCAKGCYLIKKLEPIIGRVHLPQCFGNKFLFIIRLAEDMKVLKICCPIRNRKNDLRMGHLLFKAFISSASQIMKEKIYCQGFGENTPF